jgi:hypothetical protein
LIFTTALLTTANLQDLRQSFAIFALAVLVASPNIGSYTYLLALLPVAVLLDKASRPQQIFLLTCYFLLGLPMNSSWSWFFPKLGLLVALFLFATYPYGRRVRPMIAIAAICAATTLAGFSAKLRLASYSQEPEQRFEPIAVERGAIFSSSPAVLRSGIVYQALSRDRYVLRWLHGGRIEEFRFDGHVLDPVAESPDGPVRFDLLANRRSVSTLFDPGTGATLGTEYPDPVPSPVLASSHESMTSPDKKWVVFTGLLKGNRQIWLKNVASGKTQQITGGSCSSWSAAWELDSKGIIFASDCNRGIACPALYRARLKDMWHAR